MTPSDLKLRGLHVDTELTVSVSAQLRTLHTLITSAVVTERLYKSPINSAATLLEQFELSMTAEATIF